MNTSDNPLSVLVSWVKTLSAIFTGAQTTFYYLILCTAAGTGNCNINLFIYTSVWCSNHNIISFSVYLDIPDISPGNKFFQFFYCAFSQFLLKFLKWDRILGIRFKPTGYFSGFFLLFPLYFRFYNSFINLLALLYPF